LKFDLQFKILLVNKKIGWKKIDNYKSIVIGKYLFCSIFLSQQFSVLKIELKRQKIVEVNHEHTKTHLHHACELGIKLPNDFDIVHHMEPSNEERIGYANEKVKSETIIDYQNKIGKTMIGNDVKHVWSTSTFEIIYKA
jgi:hypothetical protein